MPMSEMCEWPVKCQEFTCYPVGEGPARPESSWGECFSQSEAKAPGRQNHIIKTDYNLNICGVTIPIVNTRRTWSLSHFEPTAVPVGDIKVYLAYQVTSWLFCDGMTKAPDAFSAKEDCTIIKSTLHYLDERYGVCLYRKNIEHLSFNLNSSTKSLFKGPYGTISNGVVRIKGGPEGTKNYKIKNTEEWHFVKDGVDTVVATAGYGGGVDFRAYASGQGELLNPAYKPDPYTELLIHTPAVVSKQFIPWDDELRSIGWYDYSYAEMDKDGGYKDYFYPDWCKAMQQDPFWAAAASSRGAIYTGVGFVVPETTMSQPDLLVDPLPRGTFVKHPQVGELYQFLVGKRDGNTYLLESPNITDIVTESLTDNGVGSPQGTMLYYPIGV